MVSLKKYLKINFILLFLFLHGFFYIFIYFAHGMVPFNSTNYLISAHHFIEDPQTHGGFNLLTALGQYDSQWYLKIASSGYPSNPKPLTPQTIKHMDALTYAFFPLYPLVLSIGNLLWLNIELTAFLLSNSLIIINAFLLYILLKKHSSSNIALKTVFLLFFFPFSIIFRSYYTEGLYLFLLLLFTFALNGKKYIFAAILNGLLFITKANGWILNLYFFFLLFREYKKNNLSFQKLIISLITSAAPLIIWMVYCLSKTGNAIYFLSVRQVWSTYNLPPPLSNIAAILAFPFLPIHAFHFSKVDVLSIMCVGILLIFMKKRVSSLFWWISFSLWLSPLLVTDTMSFTRYQIVSYPLFFYLAKRLPNKYYFLILSCFLLFFYILSLYFVRWYWLG